MVHERGEGCNVFDEGRIECVGNASFDRVTEEVGGAVESELDPGDRPLGYSFWKLGGDADELVINMAVIFGVEVLLGSGVWGLGRGDLG